jgi:hypothetical protein
MTDEKAVSSGADAGGGRGEILRALAELAPHEQYNEAYKTGYLDCRADAIRRVGDQGVRPEPRGHIDSDCEVVRGVGAMCSCETPQQKADDAKYRAECEAERDAADAAASQGGETPLRSEADELRIAAIKAQAAVEWTVGSDDALWLLAENAALREQLARATAGETPLRELVEKWRKEVRIIRHRFGPRKKVRVRADTLEDCADELAALLTPPGTKT